MTTLKIYDLIGKRILVTRESARGIAPALANALEEGCGEVTLNFAGVDGLTPSFLDEVLSVLEESIPLAGEHRLNVILMNSPTQLSSKFAAVGRGHGLVAKELEPGTWTIGNTR